MKIVIISVLAVGMIGLMIPNAFAQFYEDQVTMEYIWLLVLVLSFAIPAIYAAYKQSKKDSKKPHSQPSSTTSSLQKGVHSISPGVAEFLLPVKLVCNKCGFETDDSDTFETHHSGKDDKCIKSWAGTTYYNGKWGQKKKNIVREELPDKPPSQEKIQKTKYSSPNKEEPKSDIMICKYCKKENSRLARFCGQCGKEEPKSDIMICKYCKKETPRLACFCGQCGNKI